MSKLTSKQIKDLAEVFHQLGSARSVIMDMMFPANPYFINPEEQSASVGKVPQCTNCGFAIEDGIVIACTSADPTLRSMCRSCADKRLKYNN